MCGISGMIFKYGADIPIATQMIKHQDQRGPDATGKWYDAGIALYHNRLSIVDLSPNASQPMESTRWVICYNGELYGHMELRKHLGPMHWNSHSDTLTLLNCIEHKGIDWTLEHIEGMFAFAAYDKFDKKLYLAVDPYGIKPCYWFKSDRYFAFASSPGALSLLKDKWEFNKFALIDMLTIGATKESFFTGIRKVPGGSYCIFDIKTETVTTGKWYAPKVHQCDEHDIIEAVKQSIQNVKVADVPVHLFLSGGIDSTVTASQCKYMNAVHLRSPEERYAKEVSEKYGNKLFFVDPVNYSAQECFEDYSRQSGDCAMAALIPYVVSKEVAKLGKVAISSNGADELCYGYSRMHDKPTEEQFSHIFRSGFTHSWGDYTDYKSTSDLELSTYVQYDLNKTLDFASMCHGLEVRVPYLNKTVVEMAMSVPRGTHVKEFGHKSILKRFLKSEGFSDHFLHRPKIGFSLHTVPNDYEGLKTKGLKLLREEFGISRVMTGRDGKYFEASVAAFFCWWEVYKDKI